MVHSRHDCTPAWPRPGWSTVVLGLAWGALGCARLPAPEAAPGLRAPGSFQAAEALRAPGAEWPPECWWISYGDTQLDALIDEALAGAPDLAAAAARLRMAEAMTQVAGSARRPQVAAGASASRDRLSYNDLVPATLAGWNDYGRIALDFSWELDFWGKNRAGLAAATSEREARRAEWAQARLLLAAGVAASYVELDRLCTQRETAVKALAIRQKTATLFAQRFAGGLETRGGMREADARRALAEGALLAVDEQLALQRNQLAALMGAGPDRGLAITVPTLKRGRDFGLPADLSVNLLGRRPDIVAARLQVEAMAQRIQQRKAAFYPNVNLSAMLGYQSLGLDVLTRSGSQVASAGPALSLPIFSGGRLRGQLRGAQADYAEAVARYNGVLAQALREVADNAVGQRALGPRLAKAQEAVEAAGEAHQVASNRYQGGLANYLEVLTAEDGLLNSLNVQTNLCSLSLTYDIHLQLALGGGYRRTQR